MVIKKPKRSKLVKLSFKKSQAIKADVAGIKKNIETVLLAELFLIKYINIVKAPNDTKNILENFKESDFAVTDLSHSRAVIQIEGQEVKEVLKKGCPFNFNSLEKNNSINSSYNGIAFTVDLLKDNPDKVRLFALRSFGESLYHSITDASLEFGFKSL